MRHLLRAAFLAIGLGVAVTAVPDAVSAQCIVCDCATAGCACRSGAPDGGNSCRAGDGTCMVWTDGPRPCNAFEPVDHTMVSGDGRVLVSISDQEKSGGADPGRLPLVTWEEIQPGRRIGRNCAGLVIAETYDRKAAARAKQNLEVIVL